MILMNYIFTIFRLQFQNDDFNFYKSVLIVCFFGFSGLISILLAPFGISFIHTFLISNTISVLLPFFFGLIFGYKVKKVNYSKSKINFHYLVIIVSSLILFVLGIYFKLKLFKN